MKGNNWLYSFQCRKNDIGYIATAYLRVGRMPEQFIYAEGKTKELAISRMFKEASETVKEYFLPEEP